MLLPHHIEALWSEVYPAPVAADFYKVIHRNHKEPMRARKDMDHTGS